MPRNGLNHGRVVEAAAELIEAQGAEGFSMRALAEELEVKTASLYNHVESMEALMREVCLYALKMQQQTELAAIGSKTGREAIFALAAAWRQFAQQHRELYRLILNTAANCAEMAEPARCLVGPFLQVLEPYALSETEKYHWQRILRGILHGFVAQEDAGFFSHLPVEVEESFRLAIECYITGLEQAEKRNCHAE